MSTNPPLRSQGVATPRFWRNVTLIALAHVALIAVLIRWSLEARNAPDAESLVWLSGAENIAAERSEPSATQYAKASTTPIESEPLNPDESKKERPFLTQARSEIDFPTPKPKPAATPVSKTTAPEGKTKPTPKPALKPTAKKAVLAKASNSAGHLNPAKPKEERTDGTGQKKKSAKTTDAKTKLSSSNGTGKTSSAGKGASAGGGRNASEFGWYGNMLHDRFYSAWVQPTSTVASGTRISTLVKIRIEKDGRVSKFEIIKPSENVVVNESVAAIAKRVTEVDSPPTGLINGNHYDVKINFELNTNQETAK
ncbi:MAG TPA: TonB C-terminal domain-containing protein [Candidatus Udaeobacter sp.]|jgi:outer membrane biosynthesis protein TonB